MTNACIYFNHKEERKLQENMIRTGATKRSSFIKKILEQDSIYIELQEIKVAVKQTNELLQRLLEKKRGH